VGRKLGSGNSTRYLSFSTDRCVVFVSICNISQMIVLHKQSAIHRISSCSTFIYSFFTIRLLSGWTLQDKAFMLSMALVISLLSLISRSTCFLGSPFTMSSFTPLLAPSSQHSDMVGGQVYITRFHLPTTSPSEVYFLDLPRPLLTLLVEPILHHPEVHPTIIRLFRRATSRTYHGP
jgi:hypothetical protein